jgi:hypothetical protein
LVGSCNNHDEGSDACKIYTGKFQGNNVTSEHGGRRDDNNKISVYENYCLPGSYAVSSGRELPIIQKDMLSLSLKGTRVTAQATMRHISDDSRSYNILTAKRLSVSRERHSFKTSTLCLVR